MLVSQKYKLVYYPNNYSNKYPKTIVIEVINGNVRNYDGVIMVT